MRQTFAQLQGIDPAPTQAQVGTVSVATVARLWAIVHDRLRALNGYKTPFNTSWMKVLLEDWWVQELHLLIDDAPLGAANWMKFLKSEFVKGFPQPYNFVQFALDHKYYQYFEVPFTKALIETAAAYRIVERKLVPFSSEEELGSVRESFQLVAANGALGAQKHLLSASQALGTRNWGHAIRESIAAVESTARHRLSDDKITLSKATIKLKQEGIVPHQQLANLIDKLYAYAGDEKGLRHSLGGSGEEMVSEAEAMFVFSMSAAMVGYLLKK